MHTYSPHEPTNNLLTTALNLFKEAGFRKTSMGGRIDVQVKDVDLVNFINKVVLDNGTIYLTTLQDIEELWATLITEYESVDLKSKLLSLSNNWRVLAFSRDQDYYDWCDRLTSVYASYMTKSSEGYKHSFEEDKTVVDDFTLERLPQVNEFGHILRQTTWFTFLLTLAQIEHYIETFYFENLSKNE